MGEVYKARDARLDRTVAGSIELLMTKHSKPAVKQKGADGSGFRN